jgi:hypothetical protein
MKPGMKIAPKPPTRVVHEIVVKGTGKDSFAFCRSCIKDIAEGSRHHVNRQVRLHKGR